MGIRRKKRHTGLVTFCEECGTVCDGPCHREAYEDRRRKEAADAWTLGVSRG